MMLFSEINSETKSRFVGYVRRIMLLEEATHKISVMKWKEYEVLRGKFYALGMGGHTPAIWSLEELSRKLPEHPLGKEYLEHEEKWKSFTFPESRQYPMLGVDKDVTAYYLPITKNRGITPDGWEGRYSTGVGVSRLVKLQGLLACLRGKNPFRRMRDQFGKVVEVTPEMLEEFVLYDIFPEMWAHFNDKPCAYQVKCAKDKAAEAERLARKEAEKAKKLADKKDELSAWDKLVSKIL